MSSNSDTDDDIQIKQFLEAADTTLLNNSMFEQKKEKLVHNNSELATNAADTINKDLPKSQRYINEDNESFWTDFNLPESRQKYLVKKFENILTKYYEFCDATKENAKVTKRKIKYKNCVKLLKGDECFINPYEDIKLDSKGPKKKPEIKRRIVDDETNYNTDEDVLKSVAIDGRYILSGQETKTWAKKKDRKGKVFFYKMTNDCILHAKEETNEFTKLRHKNIWNENKIKCTKIG